MSSSGGSGSDEAQQKRNERVAEELVVLLRTEVDYRRRWEPRAVRVSDLGVSYTAVARVLVDWWYKDGEREWDRHRLPVDLVRRALTGHTLVGQTLDHLTRAFDMPPKHTERLWRLYFGCDE